MMMMMVIIMTEGAILKFEKGPRTLACSSLADDTDTSSANANKNPLFVVNEGAFSDVEIKTYVRASFYYLLTCKCLFIEDIRRLLDYL